MVFMRAAGIDSMQRWGQQQICSTELQESHFTCNMMKLRTVDWQVNWQPNANTEPANIIEGKGAGYPTESWSCVPEYISNGSRVNK